MFTKIYFITYYRLDFRNVPDLSSKSFYKYIIPSKQFFSCYNGTYKSSFYGISDEKINELNKPDLVISYSDIASISQFNSLELISSTVRF